MMTITVGHHVWGASNLLGSLQHWHTGPHFTVAPVLLALCTDEGTEAETGAQWLAQGHVREDSGF